MIMKKYETPMAKFVEMSCEDLLTISFLSNGNGYEEGSDFDDLFV